MKWTVDEEICSIREVEDDFLVFIGSNAWIFFVVEALVVTGINGFRQYLNGADKGNDKETAKFGGSHIYKKILSIFKKILSSDFTTKYFRVSCLLMRPNPSPLLE